MQRRAVKLRAALVGGLGTSGRKHHGVSWDACRLARDGGDGVVAAGDRFPVGTGGGEVTVCPSGVLDNGQGALTVRPAEMAMFRRWRRPGRG